MNSSPSRTAAEAAAAYQSAVAAACGVGAPYDLKASLQHLQQAAQLGLPAAQAELAALVGNWRLVQELSAGKAQAAGSWERLRTAIDIRGGLGAPRGSFFSSEPRIAGVKRFVSSQVCDWLIRLGKPHLKR